jgi:hypothetical protein
MVSSVSSHNMAAQDAPPQLELGDTLPLRVFPWSSSVLRRCRAKLTSGCLLPYATQLDLLLCVI